MIRHKLGFRNRSALDQLSICDQALQNLGRATPEQLVQVDVAGATAAVAAARTSHARVLSLRAELRTETTRQRELLRAARQKITYAVGMLAVNVNLDPLRMQAAGLELESPKLPVGVPAAPDHFHATTHADEGTVQLRWRRTVRRCVFEIQYHTDATAADGWQHADLGFQQSLVVRGLASGAKLWFRVRAVNAHGPGPWSQPASARVK